MKAIKKKRPTLPKYTTVWDVDTVLDYLDTIDTNTATPAVLTEKTAMLLSLITAPRGKELFIMRSDLIGLTEDIATFFFTQQAKHSNPGDTCEEISIHKFENNPNLCPLTTLNSYLQLSKPWREANKETALFLTTIEPHSAAQKSTIAGWVKDILGKAGINTEAFQAHSVRGASTSKAHKQGLSLEDVLKRGHWTNKSTWQKFYHKPISSASQRYQDKILENR